MADQTNMERTFKSFLRRLQIIYLSLAAGMVLLGLLAYSLQKSPLAEFPVSSQAFVYLVPLLALIGYFGGFVIFKKLIGSMDPEKALDLKLMRYQSASLLQYACLEAPALLALFAYIKQGYLLYAAIAAFLIIYLIAQRPSLKKIGLHVPLSNTERDILMKIT